MSGDPLACRSCQAPIHFIVLASSGKSHPCEPILQEAWVSDHPSTVGKAGERVTLVSRDGKMLTGWRGSNLTPGSRYIQGYESHFARCKDAATWRKGRKT